jgi:hypothetical protein
VCKRVLALDTDFVIAGLVADRGMEVIEPKLRVRAWRLGEDRVREVKRPIVVMMVGVVIFVLRKCGCGYDCDAGECGSNRP